MVLRPPTSPRLSFAVVHAVPDDGCLRRSYIRSGCPYIVFIGRWYSLLGHLSHKCTPVRWGYRCIFPFLENPTPMGARIYAHHVDSNRCLAHRVLHPATSAILQPCVGAFSWSSLRRRSSVYTCERPLQVHHTIVGVGTLDIIETTASRLGPMDTLCHSHTLGYRLLTPARLCHRNTTESYSKSARRRVRSTHFTIYYDTLGYNRIDIEKWARLHERYRYHILETLELDPSIHALQTESYLYRHVWQKKQLTGAKYTSYVPVWNRIDQMHIAREALEGTLHHELVHVAAKAFGNQIINASWSFGLIEGLAVAVVPDISDISTIDQIVAASPNRPDAETLEAALSLASFYTGRGGVNYTTAGSFVRWLMREYPVSEPRS